MLPPTGLLARDTNPTFLRMPRDSLRAAAAPSPKMYGTMTTRRAEGVSDFPTGILMLNFRHEPGLLQSSAYTRRAPENPCDALETVHTGRSIFGRLNPKSTTG